MVIKPKIHVVATGGTIAGVAPDTTAPSSYRPGVLNVDQLLRSVPGLAERATVTCVQAASIGSEDMTEGVWLEVVRAITDARDKTDGIVVLHGTDTMEETAYFLDLIIPTGNPVVLTGAMRPANAPGADGPANILNAVLLAASPEAAEKGVLVLMNDEIHQARTVTKRDTHNVGAFVSPNGGPLGTMLDGGPLFYDGEKKKERGHPLLVLPASSPLPGVEIIYGHAGQTRLLVDAAIHAGAMGIVHAGTGNGMIHRQVLPALRDAVASGLEVVCSSRTGGGVVTIDAEKEKMGFIAARDRNPQKARVLLQLALANNLDSAAIRALFAE